MTRETFVKIGRGVSKNVRTLTNFDSYCLRCFRRGWHDQSVDRSVHRFNLCEQVKECYTFNFNQEHQW